MNPDEPQYDYGVSNDELVSIEEGKRKIIKEMGGLFKHVTSKFAEAGMRMGGQTQTPQFNDKLTLNGPGLGNPKKPISNNIKKYYKSQTRRYS